MLITRLTLEHYRNIEKADIHLSPGLTVFYGDNAQGKTNLLESACLCCIGKSHRGAKDRELIAFNEPWARVEAVCQSDNGERDVAVYLPAEGKKRILICSNPITKMADLMGCIVCTVFSPEDLKLVKEGPSLRRKFLDIELCQLYPSYYDALSHYERALSQRNSLLKQISENPRLSSSLEAWDTALARHGAKVMQAREKYCALLFERAGAVHKDISGGERLHCAYVPGGRDFTEQGLYEALQAARKEDVLRGMTTTGAHRDDFSMALDGMDLRAYGSQGQQRTAALSLKIAQLHHATDVLGEPPVFLLDDVLSELDEKRQRALAEGLSGLQALLTCAGTGAPGVFAGHEMAVYRVENGTFV